MFVSDRFICERFFGLRPKVVRVLWDLRLWRKLANYVLAEIEFKLGRRRLLSRPYWLVLDPNSGCDLQCPLCPTGKGKDTRTRAKLRWDHFVHTMDELGPTLLHVEFSNWGEPLLNPDIYDMIRYTKQYGVEVHLSSHFNHFSEAAAERVIDSGLDWMILSIDGATPESYAKYRIGGDFNRVMENLRTLTAAKRRKVSLKPYLIWQFLVFRHNEHEIEKVKAMGKEMGVDSVGISSAAIGIPEMVPQGPGAYLYPERETAAAQEMTNVRDFVGNRDKKLPLCVWPWLGTVINSNGSVSPCCGIEDEKNDYGSAFAGGFLGLWNGRDYREGRRFVVTREDNGFENTCTRCTYIGKNNFSIPDWWGTGRMGEVPLMEVFRPLPWDDWDSHGRAGPRFRLRFLLNPFYLAHRAKQIRSAEDFFGRIKNVFIYVYGRFESACYETRGRLYRLIDRCRRAGSSR